MDVMSRICVIIDKMCRKICAPGHWMAPQLKDKEGKRLPGEQGQEEAQVTGETRSPVSTL